MAKEIIDTIVAVTTKLCESDDFRKFMCGTYADGSTKSLPDAITGETLSPEQKEKVKKKKKKKKKHAKLKL